MGGIKIENYKHAIVCDYKDVVKHTLDLLKNKSKREEMGRQANLLVKNNYSYEKSAQGLNQIYREITNEKK
jgi:glycosyltransferase involved in cell wall biosynthesis